MLNRHQSPGANTDLASCTHPKTAWYLLNDTEFSLKNEIILTMIKMFLKDL